MSLTDDWETGKLKDGNYYVKLANDDIIIENLCKGEWCFDYGWHDVIVEVLARCDYDHFVELTEKAKKFEKAFTQLRQLLKECKEKIHDEFINQDIVSIDNFHDLLTRITEVLNDNKF